MFTPRIVDRSFLAILLMTYLVSTAPGMDAAETSDAGDFQKVIKPFVTKHCVACHGADKPKADFPVHDLVGQAFDPADAKRWQKIAEMVDLGDMPPSERPQPTHDQREAFKDAVNRQLESFHVGKNPWERELPRYANRVDHDALFSGKHKGPAYTAARVWRINGDIYQRLMKDFDLGFDFVVPLQKNDTGFHDYARLYADEATIRTMKQNAKRVATAMIKGRLRKPAGAGARDPNARGRYEGSKHRAVKEFLAIEGEPTRKQLQAVMTFVFQYITKLEPNEREIDRWVDEVLLQNIADGDRQQGLHGAIVAVLLSPDFLFRVEVGRGEELPDGRRMLSATELSFALSYALHHHPVESLLDAAKAGNLSTRDDVIREFRALYENPSLLRGRTAVAARDHVWQASKDFRRGTYSRPRLVEFFQQYFGYTKASDIFKDDLRHGGKHNPASLIKDTDWTILHILAEDKNVLEELLTTERFAIQEGRRKKKNQVKPGEDNPPTVHAYQEAYNLTVAADEGRGRERVLMPDGQRAGMLTHPAWLVAHSLNFHTDPVRRGKWILGHLLGYDVPELPIAVQAQLPEEHDKTIRERFRVVRSEECWRCHKKMNPLGEVFEAYDDFGRYRTQHLVGTDGNIVETEFEKLNRFNPKHVTDAEFRISVDMSGELVGTGDPTIDGPVNDPIDLTHRLSKSRRVRQVFLRHVFRFWMGRNETLDDSPTLMAMEQAYVDSGGSFKETLVTLVSSDSFLYRK